MMFGSPQSRARNKILRLENDVLDAMMSTRYAVEQGTELDPAWLKRIRESSEELAFTAENFKKQEEARERERYGSD